MNCKRMTFACFSAIGVALVLGMVGSASAAPIGTFVNATLSNTTPATTPWLDGGANSPSDNLWTPLAPGWTTDSPYGNWIAYPNETPPLLTTTASGLPPATYDVYVNYAGHTPIPTWGGIQAAIHGQTLQKFTQSNGTDTGTNWGPVGGYVYEAKLGSVAGTAVAVDVQGIAGTGGVSWGTGYWGVSYLKVGEALPVSGAKLWLDAAEGVSTDPSGNVTAWDNQVAGAPATTDFALASGTIAVTPGVFPTGTPALTFGTAGYSRLDSGAWMDYTNGYTIFVVEQAVPGHPPAGASLFIAEYNGPNKMGFNLDGDGEGLYMYARNNGSTMIFTAGTSDGNSPVIAASRLDTTSGSELLEAFEDGVLVGSAGPDAAGYGGTTVPPLSVRIGADFHPWTWVNGNIGEIVFFDRPLTDTEMGLMQDYLFNKHIVPEPSALGLAGAGVLCLIGFYRRRKYRTA